MAQESHALGSRGSNRFPLPAGVRHTQLTYLSPVSEPFLTFCRESLDNLRALGRWQGDAMETSYLPSGPSPKTLLRAYGYDVEAYGTNAFFTSRLYFFQKHPISDDMVKACVPGLYTVWEEADKVSQPIPANALMP